jgi:dephospho-CoA kinase
VGLTGGIGSGKTTVADFFKTFGVPVYIADEHAKSILNEDSEVRSAVQNLLGEKSFVLKGGKYQANKSYIAREVFNSKDKLKALNNIIHPRVRTNFDQWKSRQDHPYCLYEAAILLESGSAEACDDIILVTAPREVRMKRVMERDGANRDEIIKRMDNQWSDLKKVDLVNYVIFNIEFQKIQKYCYHIDSYLLK